MFYDKLEANGWIKIDGGPYMKGDWVVEEDTSSWLWVSTKDDQRVFDVHMPADYESGWTVNLIEHLCRMEDERLRLRSVLESIRDNPKEARQIALTALEQCEQK